MAVVKAHAYGHGLVEVGKFVTRRYAEYLGVAFPEEGVHLREAGVAAPVHVFTLPTAVQAWLYPRYHLEATVCSVTEARWLDVAAQRAGRSIPIHLKIETGLNRIGVRVEHLRSFLRSIGRLRRLELKGVFSHFATSDEQDKRFANQQLGTFHRALDILREERADPELIHMANSGAILDLPESYFSMVRAGMMMYGYYPSHTTSESVPLKPAMTLKSRVAFVKWIERGESVGYGRRFRARTRTTIATIPVGYADGFTRMLSGKATVLLHGKQFPLAGTIAMDQMMVNVGKEDVSVGDEVVLLGTQGSRTISAWDLAEKLGTVPYEICCMVSARVPRVYTQ